MTKENSEYSYHIFSFPFKIAELNKEKRFSEKSNLCEIEKIIKQTHWKRINDKELSSHMSKDEVFNINYTTKAYFYENVKRAIYSDPMDKTDEKTIVLNYSYPLTGENYYEIETLVGLSEKEEKPDKKNEKDNEKKNNRTHIYLKNKLDKNKHFKKYSLLIDKIELKMYETGVGILSFFLSNILYYQSEDILMINGLGRRVYPSFFDIKNDKDTVEQSKVNKELPNRVVIRLNGETNIEETFEYESYQKKYYDNNEDQSEIILGRHITNVLGFDKSSLRIKQIIDDRMYVSGYVLIDNCREARRPLDSNQPGPYTLSSSEYYKSDFWYKYTFVDSGMMMVQNDDMKEKLIEKSTYDRWLNFSTLYGITRYSFMLSKTSNAAFVDIHMKTLYHEMVTLVLAQRASILNFSDEVSEISNLGKANTERINNLYKNFIQFSNRLYFREITAQEQGIELYDLLLDITNVKIEMRDLKEEIESLYEYANFLESEESKKSLAVIEKLNKWFLIPTFLTGLLGINIMQKRFEVIESIPFIDTGGFYNGMFFILIIIFIPSIILYFITSLKSN